MGMVQGVAGLKGSFVCFPPRPKVHPGGPAGGAIGTHGNTVSDMTVQFADGDIKCNSVLNTLGPAFVKAKVT